MINKHQCLVGFLSQAQAQHVKAKEAVRMARDETAAKAEDVRELRTTLQVCVHVLKIIMMP